MEKVDLSTSSDDVLVDGFGGIVEEYGEYGLRQLERVNNPNEFKKLQGQKRRLVRTF